MWQVADRSKLPHAAKFARIALIATLLVINNGLVIPTQAQQPQQQKGATKPSRKHLAELRPGTLIRLQSSISRKYCGAGLISSKSGRVVKGVLLPNGEEGTLVRMATDRDRFESWRVGIIRIKGHLYQVDSDDFVAVEPQPVPQKAPAAQPPK
jgi:hypothetical protein